jgi:phosphopantothenoylcysteine decarboxylase/phosphopantothenate--cysteine ligase
MKGVTALVTAGPTHEPIDPVRFIANRSSGKQGYAIAKALAKRGAKVTLVAGPTALPDPPGIVTVHVESAREMLAAVQACLPVDVGVFCAAVVDWRVETARDEKIKKTEGAPPPDFKLVPNPDILKTVSQSGTKRPRLVVGFAAETEKVVENAVTKRRNKGCDWIIANDVSPGTGTFGGDSNIVHLVTAEGVENWMRLSKDEVGDRLAERIERALASKAEVR